MKGVWLICRWVNRAVPERSAVDLPTSTNGYDQAQLEVGRRTGNVISPLAAAGFSPADMETRSRQRAAWPGVSIGEHASERKSRRDGKRPPEAEGGRRFLGHGRGS
jgi:hypothetical protein